MEVNRRTRNMNTEPFSPPYKNGVLPSVPQNGEPLPLRPPADRVPGIKNPLLLVPQIIWVFLIILPSILWSVFRKIFPPAGKSLKDKVVLVTGAGRGLGRGLALRFAKEGAKVAVVDVFETPARQTAKEIAEVGGIAKAYTTNVAKIEEIHSLRVRVTEDLGPVDVLVNNAGLMYGNSVVEMPESDLRAVVEVNLLSHFWMAKEFLPCMKQRNSGHIVAISSESAILSLANASAYSSCKCGVVGFMDSLREELNLNPDNNIMTTTVLPYFINTSAHYMEYTDLRVPPVSTEETVDATVAGLKRNLVSFTVPSEHYIFFLLMKALPQNVLDAFRRILYSRVILPSKEVRKLEPTTHIIEKLSAK